MQSREKATRVSLVWAQGRDPGQARGQSDPLCYPGVRVRPWRGSPRAAWDLDLTTVQQSRTTNPPAEEFGEARSFTSHNPMGRGLLALHGGSVTRPGSHRSLAPVLSLCPAPSGAVNRRPRWERQDSPVQVKVPVVRQEAALALPWSQAQAQALVRPAQGLISGGWGHWG